MTPKMLATTFSVHTQPAVTTTYSSHVEPCRDEVKKAHPQVYTPVSMRGLLAAHSQERFRLSSVTLVRSVTPCLQQLSHYLYRLYQHNNAETRN